MCTRVIVKLFHSYQNYSCTKCVFIIQRHTLSTHINTVRTVHIVIHLNYPALQSS